MLSLQARVTGTLRSVGISSRPAGRVASGARIVLSLVLGGTAAALVLLHLAIFWSHLDSGALLDPAIAGRWLLGVVLVGFLVLLRRRGVPLLWGRRALVVWMLVVLLHWTAGAPGQPATIEAPHATGILFLLPATAAPLVAAAALIFFLFASAQVNASRRLWSVIPPARLGRVRTCRSRQLVPRAPPLRLF